MNYIHLDGNGRWDDLILHQVPEAVERGHVELQREVLRPQLQEGLGSPGDLLSQGQAGHGAAAFLLGRRGPRGHDVIEGGCLVGEPEPEAPGRVGGGAVAGEGGLAPALAPHCELALFGIICMSDWKGLSGNKSMSQYLLPIPDSLKCRACKNWREKERRGEGKNAVELKMLEAVCDNLIVTIFVR